MKGLLFCLSVFLLVGPVHAEKDGERNEVSDAGENTSLVLSTQGVQCTTTEVVLNTEKMSQVLL